VGAVGVLALGLGSPFAWRIAEHVEDSKLPSVSARAPLLGRLSSWIEDPPVSRQRFAQARERGERIDPSSVPRLVEWLDPLAGSFHWRAEPSPSIDAGFADAGALRVEYSLDEVLTEKVFEILRRGRVERGLAIVLDPRSGRLLAYVATDPDALPPEGIYPAASIVKILTAATLLEEAPEEARSGCVYRGNKYRLHSRRLGRPASGRNATLEEALATSNNQCFSQWAVHVLGEEKLRATFERFGWLDAPAPGHIAGRIKTISTKFELGRLGSGLAGIEVNPLHIASLASVLTKGLLIEPWWIDRIVDSRGRSLALPRRPEARRVLSQSVADHLRSMLIATTKKGTAKRAFRTRRGRASLPGIDVAGKTGNVTGGEPFGRYEWFLGLAPAEAPTIAVVVLQVQSNLWWSRSSELAAKILHTVFCEGERCQAGLADRFTGDLGASIAPLLISELERQPQIARVH